MRYDILGFGLKTGFGIDGLGVEAVGVTGLGSMVGGAGVCVCVAGATGNGYFLRMGLIRLSF